MADVTRSAPPQVKREPRRWRSPRRSQPHAALLTSRTFLCSPTLKSKLLYVFFTRKTRNVLPWISKL